MDGCHYLVEEDSETGLEGTRCVCEIGQDHWRDGTVLD